MTAHLEPRLSWRQRFFCWLEGDCGERILFFPDITDWYKARRTPPDAPQKYEPGQIIYDGDPFHLENRDMPAEFSDWTLLDFYRNFDWGCPIHLYEWRDVELAGGCRKTVGLGGRNEITTLSTPVGEIRQVRTRAADGSYCITEHCAKNVRDLDAILWAAKHTVTIVRHERIRRALDALETLGFLDIPVGRSPFGVFIHDAMGLFNGVYALNDETAAVERFLDGMREPFLDTIRAAAETPARMVIVSDHADDYLIAPPLYEKYCIPVYQEACAILHAAGKRVSTHVDGNLRSLMPLLSQTGFDVLDGCTPAPMGNYTPSDLRNGLGETLRAFCGVPAALFCNNVPDAEILHFAETIERAGGGRFVLNVGDILPPGGDIGQVIRLGEWARG